MSKKKCKVILDCQGELLEASQNVKLLAIDNQLTDAAMDEFIELTSKFARKYVRWKKRHLFPDSDLDA